MSSFFIAFAVDVNKGTTVLTRLCDSHQELLVAHKELVQSHGEDCLIVTSPALSPLDKNINIINNELLDELVAQSRIRHIVGASQAIS